MYAIVEIAGHQYKVRKDQQIYVNRLEGEEGDVVSFDKVLLTDNDGAIEVGAPVIDGIEVGAKIISHLKAEKVIVFKKKRRKGYRKKNGHRQAISLIEITEIGKGSGKKTAKKAAPKAEPKKEAPKAEKKEAPKAAPKKEAAPKVEAKKEEAPKAETKKPAAKKPAAKKSELTKIKGIGPVFAEALNKAGYTSLEQISKLTEAQMKEIDDAIDGVSVDSIKNEDWVGQAKELLK